MEESLLGFGVAVFDGVDDVVAQLVEVGLGDGGLPLGFEQRDQLALAGLEGGDLSSEGLDALPAGRLRKGAGFEGEEVSLDGFFGLGQLSLDDAQLVLVLAAFGPRTSEAGGERGVEEVVPGDGAQQRAADFAFELVGGEPFG
ncbi:MAG: hypothetical protein M0Z33_11085 [Actinomycetota bacterium]|nr:hypothetical protein [Actinomycetota bacterium]